MKWEEIQSAITNNWTQRTKGGVCNKQILFLNDFIVIKVTNLMEYFERLRIFKIIQPSVYRGLWLSYKKIVQLKMCFKRHIFAKHTIYAFIFSS